MNDGVVTLAPGAASSHGIQCSVRHPGDKEGFPQHLCPLPRSGLTLQVGVPEPSGSHRQERPLHKDWYLGPHGCLSGLLLLVIPREGNKHSVVMVRHDFWLFLSPPTGEHLFDQHLPLTWTCQKSLTLQCHLLSLSLPRHWSPASLCLHLSLSHLALRAFKTMVNPKANLVSC